MLTSDVPYSDPLHSHGMQTHHLLFTKQLFNQLLAMKKTLRQECCVVAEHLQLRRLVGMACGRGGSLRIRSRVRTWGGGCVNVGARVGR